MVAVLVVVGCDGDSPPPPGTIYQLAVVELDSLWVADSPLHRRIMVQAYPVEWSAGRTMLCQVGGGGVSTHFRLYDDGGLGRWQDGAGFADSLSGDQIAGDGLFSRRISSLFTTKPERYQLMFAFLDTFEGGDTVRATVRVVADSPPVVLWLDHPDSIYSGRWARPFTADVLDPDGESDIALVELRRASAPRGRLPGDAIPMAWEWIGINIWRCVAQPWLAAGYPTGDHRFFARAADWVMLDQDQYAMSDTITVWLENRPPRVDSIAGPDTVWVLPSDTAVFFYDVIIGDDQTAADLAGLLLTVSRYDSTLGRDTITFRSTYFDNGAGDDPIAGDGVIRAIFQADNRSMMRIPYTFTWIPTDRSPQRGMAASNTTVIMRVGNAMPGRPSLPATFKGTPRFFR